jgi:hypothetical protein
MSNDAGGDRASHVRRRFKAAGHDAMGRGFWEHWRPESSSFLAGIYSLTVLLYLEPALWFDRWPPVRFDFRVPNWVAISLLLILPINGWFIDRFLSSKTPSEAAVPRWRLFLRLLAATLPIFGIYAISLWREFLERGSFHSLSPTPRSACLDLSKGRTHLPSGVRSRALYRSGFFFIWLAASFLPALVWAVWLAKAVSLGHYWRFMTLGACVLLHLIAYVCVARYSRFEIQSTVVKGWRRVLLLASPFLSLLAIPGTIFGFAALLFVNPSRSTLTGQAHDSRSSAARVPVWRKLQEGVREQWQGKPWFRQWHRPFGLENPDRGARADEQAVRVYRWKTLTLVLEGGALLKILMALALRAPNLHPLLNSAVRYVMFISASLAVLGLAIQVVGFSARLLRIQNFADSLSRHPYGRYLLLTQIAFLAGIEEEFLLSQRQITQFGTLLTLGSILCVTLLGVMMILSPFLKLNRRTLSVWSALFFTLSALGAVVTALGKTRTETSLATYELLTALTPLWSLSLFLALGGWLLRPFSWRHVFDPRLPRRLRATLALLLLTAALPLGGLTIPFWIYARHRLWPRYAPLLSKGAA